mgnify:CR=1 FL=1
MDKLSTITLSGKEYPMRCSNFVLQEIQEKYKDLSEFERKLAGRIPALDENGKQKYNDEGKKLYIQVETSLEAINFFLPLVVNEGIEVEAILKNKEAKTLDPKQIIRMNDVSPYKLQEILLEEFFRAFEIKK